MPTPEVTQLLHRWRDGDAEAQEAVVTLVYDELRRLAHHYLGRERAGHTFSTTDLVHEAYANLAGSEQPHWRNRQHFFALAARVMRHLLVDHARARRRDKRGGGLPPLSLDHAPAVSEDGIETLLSLEQALTELEAHDARLGRVVECRYFGGLSVEETAAALEVSPATVKRDWQFAKAWLRQSIYGVA